MDDPIGHFKLPAMTKMRSEGQRVSLPVESHLSIKGNLVGPADETELLAAGVVGRPLACVWLIRACSVSFAELSLRDVFAALVFLPHIVLNTRKCHISLFCTPN